MSTDGVVSQLIVEPPRIVLNDFMSWVLDVNTMGEQEPKQVIMLGYNSWKFDDNFLLFHLRQKVEKDLLLLARKNVFTCDAMSLMKLKGTLQSEFLAHGGNEKDIVEMHDALQDCKAVLSLLKKNNINFLNVMNNTRSLESLFDRATNPLLKAGFITDIIANKMTTQITCDEYLRMSEDEVYDMFTKIKLTQHSIKICIEKRNEYRELWLLKREI